MTGTQRTLTDIKFTEEKPPEFTRGNVRFTWTTAFEKLGTNLGVWATVGEVTTAVFGNVKHHANKWNNSDHEFFVEFRFIPEDLSADMRDQRTKGTLWLRAQKRTEIR